MNLDAIKIGKRHRQDMGDIDGLAASITELGLLHPIVVTPDGKLIAGERRILAFQKLGRKTIPHTTVDLVKIVRGEYAENFFRKAFSPSEIVAITEAIEPLERAKAKERMIAGKGEGGSGGRGKTKPPGKFPEGLNGQALDHVAKAVGKDRKTITKAREVVEAAKTSPGLFAKIKADMDRTGKVDSAYKAVQSVKRQAEFEAAVEHGGEPKTGNQFVILGDCLAYLRETDAASFDIVVTSPPYNIGTEYRTYRDNVERAAYLVWLTEIGKEIKRALTPKGSFFLNIGSTGKDPWIEFDVAQAMRGLFCLQNHIVWIKAIAIDGVMQGHYKPITSGRFIDQAYESVFHFTLNGDVEIDRLAVGVPFADKSNIERRGHGIDRHCGGNVWFIPYETVQSKTEKFHHPAGYPVELAERCIKLHGLRGGPTVFDPFMGTGTTLVAAERLGLVGTGVELDSNYARIASMRLGQKAA